LDRLQVALVLGLFDDRDALRELRALPRSLPEAVDEIVCLTPAFEPPPDVERGLSAIRVRVARLSSFDSQISLSDLMHPPARTVPLVPLSAEQELEALAAGFTCRWPIVITGARAKGGANIVEINGEKRPLGSATFPLFVRLLAGLFETTHGFLPKGRMLGGGGLADEGYYTSDGMDQAIGRLRNALGPFRSLVEVTGRMIRISAHPGYVRLGIEALASHPDDRVQDLTRRIAATRR
jgi:hypothetical protein